MCEVRQILVGLIREDFLEEESFLEQLEYRTELIPNSSPFLVGSSNAFSEKESLSQLPAKLAHQSYHFPQSW